MTPLVSKVLNTEMTRLQNLFLLIKKCLSIIQLPENNQLKANMFEFNSHNGYLCTQMALKTIVSTALTASKFQQPRQIVLVIILILLQGTISY